MKNIIILCNEYDGIVGATNITDAINGREGDCKAHLFLFDGYKWNSKPFRGKTHLILRWATTSHFFWHKPDVLINTATAIENTHHKPTGRRLMQEAGVPVPKTWFDSREATIPFIARPPKHTGGQDFIVIKSRPELPKLPRDREDWYYSEVYPKDREYRVHVWRDKVMCSYEKYLQEGEIRGNQLVTGLGWSGQVEVDESIKQVAIDACKALKLDTGAVDIMTSTSHEHPVVVCEVNAQPTIKTDLLTQTYATYVLSEM